MASDNPSVIDTIRKRFGEASVFVYGEVGTIEVPTISTGALPLDMALGVGGLPLGRIVEVFGPESSGKTTLCLHAIANAQKAGLKAAFVDAEHALDPTYARALGVDLDSLMISQPDYGEQALDIVDMFIRSGEVGVVVIDSVAALIPKDELDGDMGDHHVGRHARLMSQAMRKLTGGAHGSNTCVIFINQTRTKIGKIWGSPTTTTGGNALKFYASVRLDIRRISTLKEGESAVGNRTRVKVVKNKLAAPFAEAEFDIMYGVGIDRAGCVLDLAVDNGLVKKSGAWFSYNGDHIGQGRPKAKAALMENLELLEELECSLGGEDVDYASV